MIIPKEKYMISILSNQMSDYFMSDELFYEMNPALFSVSLLSPVATRVTITSLYYCEHSDCPSIVWLLSDPETLPGSLWGQICSQFCFSHSVDICSDSTEAKVDKTADILAQIKTAPPAALADILFFICMHWQKAKQRVSLRNDVDEAAVLLILLNHDPRMCVSLPPMCWYGEYK